MKRLSCVSALITSALSIHLAFGQGETAVPFLLIPANPAANGFGGISTSVVSSNPMATIANPAQVGIFSLTQYFSASTYVPKTDWLPGLDYSGVTYNVSAVNAGVNLSQLSSVPFPLGIGAGYSRIYLDLGTFIRTGPGGPEPVGTFRAFEKVEAFTLGVGIDYYVRLGIGLSAKYIHSALFPIGTEQEPGAGTANLVANDIGGLIEVPITDIISKVTGEEISLTHKLSPLCNLSAGYAHRNHGGKVIYADAAQPDPLPRQAAIGMALELGLNTSINSQTWKIVSFTLAREAEDLLVRRRPDGSFDYASGLGRIRFFNNLILGEWDGRITLRKGWEFNVAEIMYLRGGSSTGSGNLIYHTNGFGFQLSGLIRLFDSVGNEPLAGDIASLIRDHIDIHYDHAQYSDHPIVGNTTFNALNLIIK
jgi:hypothetical protein